MRKTWGVMSLLGVPELDRMLARSGSGGGAAADWAADQIVIYGLGLGLRETLRFLHAERPDLEGFERWIIAANDGAVPQERIDWVNAALGRIGEESSLLSEELPRPLDQEELRFWDQNGYVLVRDAVTRASASAAAEAIWTFLGASPHDPGSWGDEKARDGLWVPLLRHSAFDANRASPRIKGAFAQLWGTGDLLATIDQGGFNPPERPDRPFRGQGLHWDTSLALPIPLGIQGILYLTDTPAEQGAFRCVPGFHRRIGDWLAGLPAGADPRGQILPFEAECVAGKAGDMILWHAALPHGASPNRGNRPRLVQYISYFPPGRVDDRPWI